MALRYFGFLAFGSGASETALPIGRFDVHESYNGGWTAKAAVFAASDTPVSVGSMVGNALRYGIVPGRSVVLRLAYDEAGGEPGAASVVRSWPGVISSVEPLDAGTSNADIYCLLTIVDAVSYLRDHAVWGVYRATAAAEIVGGAISLAAGTDGKPTLNPSVPVAGNIEIVPRLRTAMDWLPHAVAVGQPLGAWLYSFFGLLGIRMEMLGKADGTLSVILADTLPQDEPLQMSLPADETLATTASGEEGDETGQHGELSIASLSARHGSWRRSVLLDDPTQGQLRRIGRGPVGTYVSGVDVSLDEAYIRSEQQLMSTASQLLSVGGQTRQPGLRPGRRVTLDRAVRGIKTWQAHSVTHSLRGLVYGNRTLLLSGFYPWYPPRPTRTAPIIVPGIVDGGRKFVEHEPVPRDRLGRIPVRFPFAPLLDEEDAFLAGLDKNKDHALTLKDFRTEHRLIQELKRRPVLRNQNDDYRRAWQLMQTEQREAEVEALRAGDLEDRWPGLADDELGADSLEERRELEAKRTLAYRYLAYKRAVAQKESGDDVDRDGHVTMLDELVSDELREHLQPGRTHFVDEKGTKRYLGEYTDQYIQEMASKYTNMDGTPDERRRALGIPPALLPAVQEYADLFGPGPAPDWETHIARLDADAAEQRWPARVPLCVVQPMAGGLHGFVAAHRQGDVCRVAVHDPLFAEIVGFEYRGHGPLAPGMTDATAGVVVEHDRRIAWSGLLFKHMNGDDES